MASARTKISSSRPKVAYAAACKNDLLALAADKTAMSRSRGCLGVQTGRGRSAGLAVTPRHCGAPVQRLCTVPLPTSLRPAAAQLCPRDMRARLMAISGAEAVQPAAAALCLRHVPQDGERLKRRRGRSTRPTLSFQSRWPSRGRAWSAPISRGAGSALGLPVADRSRPRVAGAGPSGKASCINGARTIRPPGGSRVGLDRSHARTG
jgi:hypothetical protein